ncbi:hypothetical protein K432DRAFT_382938 [Lepidopterella palustris CBS 459.81]|uniref:Extracellular serine-rich protein n=1 Tax=Lepidopterella palustris CBS 459.81 TaxID=1314670 RepID=A0A8E2E993_9PEZI|nr:hypothetical protein K432DRAFT_382938 [Lepidopterella palustris CBS 459.81]
MLRTTRAVAATFLILAQIGAVVSAQSSSAADTASLTSITPSTISSASSPSATSEIGPQVHVVSVGKGGFKFDPDTITANVGDIIEFQFFPPNHSVVRAEYEYPCIPYEDTGPHKTGFFSGFRVVDTVDQLQSWNVTINDTAPIFFYCSAPGSCINYEMVGVVNPNKTQTLATQKAFAANSSFMLNPGEPIPAEASGISTMSLTTTIPSSTSTSTPTGLAAASQTPSSSSHHSLSGGAIAGIAVGAAALLALCGALFFFVGRAKSLKEVLERKDATVVTTTQVPPEPFLGGGYSPGFAQPNDYRQSNMSQLPPSYYQHHVPPSESNPSEVGSPRMTGTEFGASFMPPVNEVTEKAELASPTVEHTGPIELEAPVTHKPHKYNAA